MMCTHGRRHGRHLRHRIFIALGATIVLSVGVAGFVVHSAAGAANELGAFKAFASDRFLAVWDDPPRRNDLARSIESHFRVRLTLRDGSGQTIYGDPNDCARGRHRIEVADGSRVLGQVETCILSQGWPKSLIYGLGSLILVLWAMSGYIARLLVRPLDELVRVVRDIGDGHLDARIGLCSHHHRGEVGEVAQAVNLMAEKIERQIAGQRELLAAVSHEIRSPLARLRVLVELAREAQGDAARLDSMDVELTEMDSLIGQLLAQSRLEFQKLELRAMPAVEVAQMALSRAGKSLDKLSDATAGLAVDIDVTLFTRALLNMIENADRHGGGLVELKLEARGECVRFKVRDQGQGFDESMEKQAFLPFVGTGNATGLGLGLALVERIARAHGTAVHLESVPGKGATVSIDARRSHS